MSRALVGPILVVFRPPKEGHALGLRLHPHERIARHLDCPVVVVLP